MKRLVIGIAGASGVIYAVRLLEVLHDVQNVETHLVLSDALNIINNSQVAATIQEDYKDWKKIKGIQLEGVVHKISGSKQADAIARYMGKFPLIGKKNPTEIGQALHRVSWYALTPSLLYFIDNSLGLGHRDRVDLKKD